MAKKVSKKKTAAPELSRQRRWQERMKSEGRCPNCGRPADPGFVHCVKCLARARKRYTPRGRPRGRPPGRKKKSR